MAFSTTKQPRFWCQPSQVCIKSFQNLICSSSQTSIASCTQSQLEAWRTFRLLTWYKEVNFLASADKTMIWVETMVKKSSPSLHVSVLNPHWHTSVWQWRVAQTDRQSGSEEKDFCHLCETSKKVCLLNLQETLSERERKKWNKNKKLPMGLRRHLYWFLSLSFPSVSLFVSVYVSLFDGRVFPVQVVFSVFPQMRQKTMTAKPFLYHH